MGRFLRMFGLAALLLVCWSSSAHGFGWRLFPWRAHYRVVYYYPAYPTYVVPACYPVSVPVPQYAMPKAAPASGSQTGEPPLGSTKPTVTESRSHGGKYAAAKDAKDERCRVGFWNITGRDVTILVEGQSRALARNQSLTVDLTRSFSWQIDGRQQADRVPDGQITYDIVLRP